MTQRIGEEPLVRERAARRFIWCQPHRGSALLGSEVESPAIWTRSGCARGGSTTVPPLAQVNTVRVAHSSTLLERPTCISVTGDASAHRVD
jgi:hypothetical protein